MNKIIVTIILGLIAATAVGFLYFSNLDTSMQDQGDEQTMNENGALAPKTEEQFKGKDSLMSLFKLGKSMECTFAFSTDGIRGEGTAFFDGENSRVDSLYSNTDTDATASYMITDAASKTMYTWTLTDGVGQGFKMAIPDDSDNITNDMAVETPSGTVNPETDVEYDCKPWIVDKSVFVPPNDIEFMDMMSIQKEMEALQIDIEDMTPADNL